VFLIHREAHAPHEPRFAPLSETAFCKEGETAEPSRFFAGDSQVAREEWCAEGAPDAVKRWVLVLSRRPVDLLAAVHRCPVLRDLPS